MSVRRQYQPQLVWSTYVTQPYENINLNICSYVSFLDNTNWHCDMCLQAWHADKWSLVFVPFSWFGYITLQQVLCLIRRQLSFTRDQIRDLWKWCDYYFTGWNLIKTVTNFEDIIRCVVERSIGPLVVLGDVGLCISCLCSVCFIVKTRCEVCKHTNKNRGHLRYVTTPPPAPFPDCGLAIWSVTCKKQKPSFRSHYKPENRVVRYLPLEDQHPNTCSGLQSGMKKTVARIPFMHLKLWMMKID